MKTDALCQRRLMRAGTTLNQPGDFFSRTNWAGYTHRGIQSYAQI